MRTEIDINSNDNSLFVTSQCDNRCLMCSQPPLVKDDIDYYFKRNLSIIDTLPNELKSIGITGGEPTLAKEKFLDLLTAIQVKNPEIDIHVLSNGRVFSSLPFTLQLAERKIENLLLGIPLHSDFSSDHDRITQVKGSFTQTIKALYNLDRFNVDIELRIVIHKLNYQRLPKIAKYIFKNLPFVRYISFMGLEYTGYMIKNSDLLWIDPIDYSEHLEEAVLDLATWGMNVSVFNLPHCLLKPSLYEFACQSISDWKMFYPELCNSCQVKEECCGLFTTSKRQSLFLKPIS